MSLILRSTISPALYTRCNSPHRIVTTPNANKVACQKCHGCASSLLSETSFDFKASPAWVLPIPGTLDHVLSFLSYPFKRPRCPCPSFSSTSPILRTPLRNPSAARRFPRSQTNTSHRRSNLHDYLTAHQVPNTQIHGNESSFPFHRRDTARLPGENAR